MLAVRPVEGAPARLRQISTFGPPGRIEPNQEFLWSAPPVDDLSSTRQHARVRIGGDTRIAEGPKSTRPSRGQRVDYAQKMQEMQRASPGTASAKAEVALESLKNGEFTSQTKAAAAGWCS